jgi:hypothetical protein
VRGVFGRSIFRAGVGSFFGLAALWFRLCSRLWDQIASCCAERRNCSITLNNSYQLLNGSFVAGGPYTIAGDCLFISPRPLSRNVSTLGPVEDLVNPIEGNLCESAWEKMPS